MNRASCLVATALLALMTMKNSASAGTLPVADVWVSVTVAPDVFHPMSTGTIELTMQRDAELWKVTEFKDDVVVQRVVDSVMRELPAIGSIQSDSPLFKKQPRRRSRNSR